LSDQKLLSKRWLIAGILLIMVPLAMAAQQSTSLTPPTLGTYERNPRYLLNPGDVVDVQYRYTPEYNQTVTIQPDGFVSLEIVGDVKIGSLNLEQARSLLLKKAGTRLKEPEITLILKEFQKPYFVVAGEVPVPGKFDLREKMTALQAVMLAGGFKPSARSSEVLLFRKINSETAEVKVLSLKNINRTSDLEEDLALEAGDMLFVPQNRLAKVERYMKLANIGLFFNPLDVLRR
jgi:polysaccharide export outer membrane protein